MFWDKHHQTFFPSKNVLLYLSAMRYPLSFITKYPCKQTNNTGPTYCKSQNRWNPLQLCPVQLYAARFSLNRRCKLAVTRSISTCRQLYNLQDFPLLFVIIFLTIPQQQVMAPEILQPEVIEAESSRTTGASNNAPPSETPQQCRHQVVHRNAAIVATENMTQNARLKIVSKTVSNRKQKHQANGCESIHINVDDGRLTVSRTAGVRRELRDQCIAAYNGKSPWLTKAIVCTVREIEDDGVVSSEAFADEFGD